VISVRNLAHRIGELERAYDVAPKTNPCEAILCALSCVVSWSTQALQGYTGLILRQLICNDL